MSIESLKSQLPEYAKDLKLNLSSVLAQPNLNDAQTWGTALVAAIASRNPRVLQSVAAEAGKHILVEKPMALSVADARTMIDAAHRNAVVLAVNHHLPGSPLHATARQLVADGRIGTLVGARINNAGTLPTHLRGWRLSGARERVR